MLALRVFRAALVLVAFAPSDASAPRTKRRDLDPQTCVDNFDIHRDKIIRTEDSREMGAKYLNEVDLGSRDECLRLCCETDTCDVFVFEEKSPGSCYLFHCGPPEDFKCKFTRHTNFTSAVLAVNRHLAELEDQIKLTKHEQDLASLRKQFQEVITTVKPTTSHPVQSHETIVTIPVARRCSRYQFECHSSDECIAIYNACDGIPQCADGSDEAPELGCPATTTALPPSNFPPREILPHIPPVQQAPQYGPPENMPINKEIPVQHQSAFSPVSSQDGPQWPHHLDQLPQSVPHPKQYHENVGSSHIFNHKGGLQVTETEGLGPAPFDYKALPYDSIPENWQHRQWPQPQTEQMNINDGYHMEMEPKGPWKQSMQQNIQIQGPKYAMDTNQNRLPPELPSDKMNIPVMPNMFQDRDKMWIVPHQPNLQENQEGYTQRKNPQHEDVYIKPKYIEETEKSYPKHMIEKTNNEQKSNGQTADEGSDHANDDLHEDHDAHEDHDHSDDGDETKQKDGKGGNKKQNKTKKKHLKDNENDKKSDDQGKDPPVSSSIIMGKLFEDDAHDGAAERPPGAILLLTLGICMTSIMIVLIGCRLKMARRRMRRLGKSPFAHDADYLVNGMYL